MPLNWVYKICSLVLIQILSLNMDDDNMPNFMLGTNAVLPLHHQHDQRLQESDEFRMYAFKIKRCSKNRSHDWTECPYAHRGEKARRRDPRKHPYAGVACAEFRQAGDCSRGQQCEFAHGVFEFWLHPTRYRTRPCNAGTECTRKVCFFAHTVDELREERESKWLFKCWAATAAPVNGMVVVEEDAAANHDKDDGDDRVVDDDVLEGFNRLSLGEDGKLSLELPDIGWICELLK